MRNRLYPSSIPEKLQYVSQIASKKGTALHRIVFVMTLFMVEQTGLVRGAILNADMYEEDDFAVSMYNSPTMEGQDEESVIKVGHNVLGMIQEEVSN
jgi:hypothetical protein